MDQETEAKIEKLFEKADPLMIESKDYKAARKIYEEILHIEAENVDALNSLATCI